MFKSILEPRISKWWMVGKQVDVVTQAAGIWLLKATMQIIQCYNLSYYTMPAAITMESYALQEQQGNYLYCNSSNTQNTFNT